MYPNPFKKELPFFFDGMYKNIYDLHLASINVFARATLFQDALVEQRTTYTVRIRVLLFPNVACFYLNLALASAAFARLDGLVQTHHLSFTNSRDREQVPSYFSLIATSFNCHYSEGRTVYRMEP